MSLALHWQRSVLKVPHFTTLEGTTRENLCLFQEAVSLVLTKTTHFKASPFVSHTVSLIQINRDKVENQQTGTLSSKGCKLNIA